MIKLYKFFVCIFRGGDVRHTETRDQPEEKEDAVIIPNVVCEPLQKKGKYTAEDAEADQAVGTVHRVSAKAEGTLCERKDETEKDEKREEARFHGDLEIKIVAVGCGLDAGKRVNGVELLECAFTDADAVKSDIVEHTDNALPDTETVRGGAVTEACDAAQDRRIDLENGKRGDDGHGEQSCR